MASRRLVEASRILVEGPWIHRDVSANGIRLHLAESGSGPLILLLHGFPQFWWAWRYQLVALAEAGFRAVAPDLRGYGASDKPPRGYDVNTLSADMVGLIRALGETDARLVGHDWGGLLAMTMAQLYPEAVRRLALIGIAHPVAMRSRLLRHPLSQGRRSSYLFKFQLPWLPERWLVANDATNVGRLLHAWGGPAFPSPEAEGRYREAMQILYVPHRALEYYRWLVRSQLRPDGAHYSRMMASPLRQPTLQLHGELDRCILPETARGTAAYVQGSYTFLPIPGVGHFPAEEAPDLVNGELVQWAKEG
ncbi:MAG: alpha/beta fold hydrolase [Mycobacteriales bacterium]